MLQESEEERQRRESNVAERCDASCSIDENEYPEECLFDCLALAQINVSLALRVNEMHVKISRERDELLRNDRRVVDDFRQCYQEGRVCLKTNAASLKNVSLLFVVGLLLLLLLINK